MIGSCTAMKMKQILTDTLFYWLQIIICIWPSFLIGEGIVGMAVSILVKNANIFLVRISETLASVLVLCALLLILAYRRGHKKGETHRVGLLISLTLAIGMQLIYASLLRYAVYTTAGAYYFAHMLHAGAHQELTFAYFDVPAHLYILAMCAVACLYIIAVIVGETLGKRKRLRERAALRLHEQE